MPNLPISQLPEINLTDPQGLLVFVTSGTTYKIPFSSFTKDFAITKVSGLGHLPVYSGNNTFVTSIIHETLDVPYLQRAVHIGHYDPYHDPLNPDKLGVYAGETDSFNLVVGRGSIDGYLQFNCRNFSSGGTASSDVVATADNGTESEYYIDMGINSSQYSATTIVGSFNDAYVYSTGNNLFIGNASPDKKLILFNGGYDTNENAVMFVHENRAITINTPDVDPSNPSALRIVNANAESTSMIRSESDIDNFAEINSVNNNSGNTASSDVVATNDIGAVDDTQGFIDMGINSSTFNVVGDIGQANDAYLYSTGRDLYIGNATAGQKLVLFNGGADTTAYAKFFIHEDASITINTAEVDVNNPAAIRIVNANGTTSMIHADGAIDDFSEIANVNSSAGNNASADIICTNNIGNTDPTQGYIDMGINSSTYNVPNYIGGPNDAYLYSTGESLYIGNATENTSSNTYIFTNGTSDAAVRIAVKHDGTVGFHNFYPEYPVDISGTTRVQDGGFIVSNGQTNLGVVIEAADNADAIASGLTIGDVYRTGDFLKIVH